MTPHPVVVDQGLILAGIIGQGVVSFAFLVWANVLQVKLREARSEIRVLETLRASARANVGPGVH